MSIVTNWASIWSISDRVVYANTGGAGTPSISGNVVTIPYRTFLGPQTYGNNPGSKSIRAIAARIKLEDPGAGVTATILTVAIGGDTMEAVRVDGTNFNIRLHTGATTYTGATNLAWGTFYYFLWEQDGTNWTLWIGTGSPSTTPEIQVANTSKSISTTPGRLGHHPATGDTTKNIYFGAYWQGSYDNTARDRPDPSTVSYDKLVPTTGTRQFDQWTGIFPNTGEDKSADVDDWNTGNDDTDSTYVGHPGTAGAQYDQTFETINPTVTNPISLQNFFKSRVAVDGKGNTIDSLIGDGGSNSVYGAIYDGEFFSTYGYHRYLHNTNPSSAAWDATSLNSLELGVSTKVDAEDANGGRLTAIQGEVIGLQLGFAPTAIGKAVQVNQAVNRASTY